MRFLYNCTLGVWITHLDELAQILPIFGYILQFFAEIWQKIGKICPKILA